MNILSLPVSGVRLGARLRGVDGFTGRGEISYARQNNGEQRMRVQLQGLAGRSADVFVNGAAFRTVFLDNGFFRHAFDSTRGERIPTLNEGAVLEIRQNGHLVLEGSLARDRWKLSL